MDPGSQGWLKEYLELRQEFFQEVTSESHKASHPDQSLYRLVQPTGLMYGQPIKLFDHPSAADWDQKDRMKILLAESLISSALLFQGKPVRSPDEISAIALKTLESISNFYNHIFPELSTPTKTLFGRKRTPLELAEKILDKRIERSSAFSGNFWTEFFHNSLLFLDIFIFGQWIHTNADKIVSDFFKYEREELRTSLVKIMAAAAHSNHILEFEEKKLLEYFLQSAQLPLEKKNECHDIFNRGVSVEDINLPTNNSWILKKYFWRLPFLRFGPTKRWKERVEFSEALR